MISLKNKAYKEKSWKEMRNKKFKKIYLQKINAQLDWNLVILKYKIYMLENKKGIKQSKDSFMAELSFL